MIFWPPGEVVLALSSTSCAKLGDAATMKAAINAVGMNLCTA
jgi:hypothetical protein